MNHFSKGFAKQMLYTILLPISVFFVYFMPQWFVTGYLGFLIVFMVLFGRKIMLKSIKNLELSGWLVFLMLGLLGILSVSVSAYFGLLDYGLHYGITLIFMLLLFLNTESIKQLKALFFAMGLLILCSAMVAIVEYCFKTVMPSHWLDQKLFDEIRMRVTGGFMNPNAYGLFLAIVLPLMVYQFPIVRHKKQRYFYSVVIIFGFIGLFLTYSRAAYLAVIFEGVLLWVFNKERLRSQGTPRRIHKTIGVGLLIAVVLVLWKIKVLGRLISAFNFEDSSIQYRLDIYNSTINIFRDHWVLGIGLGQFQQIYPAYAQKAWNAAHAHNTLLMFLAETGVVGTLYLFVILAVIGASLYKQAKIVDSNTDLSSALCISGSGIGIMVYGCFDYVFTYYHSFFFVMMVMAMALIVSKVCENSSDDL